MEAAPTARESVEDILRPLVEARVRVFEGPGPEPFGGTLFMEDPDPRFDALRCKHPRAYGHSHDGHTCCPDCGYESMENEGGIDASLGAIVRAAAAFGLDVVELYQWPGGNWGCSLRHYLSTLPTDPKRPHGSGDTPEEAAARALVAAWRDEKAHSATGGMHP